MHVKYYYLEIRVFFHRLEAQFMRCLILYVVIYVIYLFFFFM